RGLAGRPGHLHHPDRRPARPPRHGAEARGRVRLLGASGQCAAVSERNGSKYRRRLGDVLARSPLMHIDDLAVCKPWDDGTSVVRAIGWLEPGYEYSRGDVSKDMAR